MSAISISSSADDRSDQFVNPIVSPGSDSPSGSGRDLPPLYGDSSFWGLAATQFLGAFNDNLFKQLMLLLATPAAAAVAAAGAAPPDRQSEAMIVFAASFLMFCGVAGYLADRTSKRKVIILSKVAEIAVMLAGMAGFYLYDRVGFAGLLVVLYFMGMQSAFFGPAKYGVLPEMLRDKDLPRANGIFLMLTFLAIIFGTALAGILLTVLEGAVWMAAIVCLAVAVLGTLTSTTVRRVPVAVPNLPFSWRACTVPPEMIQLLRQDRELLGALMVASTFWMLGGIVQQTVNALGKTQLGLPDYKTSLLAAMIGVGIACGCALGGYLSRGRISSRVVKTGAWGIVVCLFVLSLPGGPKQQLLGFAGSLPVLVVLGTFTGMFIVPIQVLLQVGPPMGEKGRMIAVMNQGSWVGIVFGAILYQVCVFLLNMTGGPRSAIFAVTAAIMLPVALCYRPKDRQLI